MDMTISNLHYTNMDIAQTQSAVNFDRVEGDTLEVRQRHKSLLFFYHFRMKLISLKSDKSCLEAYFRLG